MPSSRPHTIPSVIHLLRQLKPCSILDVGVGFGKWGHLFREYTDINAAERDPSRYERKNWRVRIDGIEGHAPYLTEMHRYLYDHIYIGDARDLLPTLPEYDLIFLGDIIEHLEKEAGRGLLGSAVEKARMAVLVSTPRFETGQCDLCGNDLERHRSLWTVRDFKRFAGARVQTVGGDTLLAVLPKHGLPPLKLAPPGRARSRESRLWQETRRAILRLLPPASEVPFILVDEEQMRSLLPHRCSFPFLEKNGVYWGAPPDDETAIAELERLRAGGAKYVVLIWTTFWWMESYPRFAEHLRGRYACREDSEVLKVFDLAAAPA
jgi:hypothetical protein